MSKRRAWFEAQPDLDPGKLVFIDETWTATDMARTHGRCARGERLRMGFPHGHREKAAERTVDGVWAAIGRLVDVFTPQECANYFAAAGYDADLSGNALVWSTRRPASTRA